MFLLFSQGSEYFGRSGVRAVGTQALGPPPACRCRSVTVVGTVGAAAAYLVGSALMYGY